MKITLEMISRDLAIKFPEIITTPAFDALTKLGRLRATKDIGVDIEMLQRDYKIAMQKTPHIVIIDDLTDDHVPTEEEKAKVLFWYNKCFPEKATPKSKAPVEETTRQPEPPAVVPAASVAQDASASPDVSLQAAFVVDVKKLGPPEDMHIPPGTIIKLNKDKEIPDFLKEALKGIK